MQDNYENIYNMLKEKGFTLPKILEIRKTFADSGKDIDENIEFDNLHNLWKSKKRSQSFNTIEEVKFFNALVDFSPETETKKIMQVMCVVIKLLDIDSECKF
jgi:hypothetical protein